MGTLTKAARPFLALQREPFSSERTWAFPTNALQYPRKRGESTSLRRGDGPSEPRPPPPPVHAGTRASPLSSVEGGEGGGTCPLCHNERTNETERGKVSLSLSAQSSVAF